VSISATASDGWMTIIVDDDGEDSPTQEHGNGIGLANVRDRLEARYGDRASLAKGRKPDGGYRATIVIPISPKDLA
ncbi:MAG: sensor histidine kinase, partial [Sphingorhabdus sp.]